MRTENEFISAVHNRARELRKQRLRRNVATLAGVCVAIVAFMISVVSSPSVIGTTNLAGTSLLDSSIGGYVLVAVLAFMLGTIITVSIKTKMGAPKGTGQKEAV